MLQATYTGTTAGGPMWYWPGWDVFGNDWDITDYRALPYHLQQFRVAADGNYVVYSVQNGYDGYGGHCSLTVPARSLLM